MAAERQPITGAPQKPQDGPEQLGELYRAALASCPDGILVIDLQGRIHEVNDAYVRRSGYSRAELLQMHISQLLTDQAEDGSEAWLQKVVAQGALELETRHRTKAGELWLVEVSASFLAEGGGLCFSFCRDVTKRRRAEALLGARVRLSRLAQQGSLDDVMQETLDTAERLTGSSIGFFHFVDPDQERLRLQCWSTNTVRNMCKADGKGAHYDIAQAGVWVDCFHARAPVIHNDYVSLAHKKGMPAGHAPVVRELVIPVLQGDLVVAILGVGNKGIDYVADDVALIEALASFALDLVARKRAEEELRVSEERFRSLYETMAQGVIYRSADGSFESANPAALRILGLTLDEMRERGPLDPRWRALREDGSPQPADEQPSMLALRTGQPVKGLVVGLHNARRGGYVWCLLNAIPRFRLGETKPCQVCVTLEDISARKEAEVARLELERRTQRLKQLESLGDLAGGVAHDFNNILTAVVGRVELAACEVPRDSAASGDLGAAQEALSRATGLCQQMLALSGRGRFLIAPATWTDFLRGREAELSALVSPRVQLMISVVDAPRMEVDAAQLRRLVHHLVENAGEALGSAPGTLRVTATAADCSRADLDACVLGEALPPGRYAVLEVSDTGHGMDTETVARIFDPFFTTRFTGRGLGMSEVLGIVRAHKGAIRVQSSPGGGTTVRVLFPCLTEKPPSRIVPAAAPVAEEGAAEVLLVDDETIVSAVAQRILARAGLRTLVAASGPEALDVFRRHGGRVGLVILDMTMPGMSGEETLVELRRLSPSVQVLMSSGFAEQSLESDIAGWRVQGFLQKPYSGTELVQRVRAALACGSPASSSPGDDIPGK